MLSFIPIFKNNLNNHYRMKLFLIILLFVAYLIILIYKKIKKNELKRKFNNLFPFQKKIIDNYFSNISSKYYFDKENEALKLISLVSLLNYSEITDNALKFEKKQQLLKELQTKDNNKNVSEIKFVYIDKTFNYGNSMVLYI